MALALFDLDETLLAGDSDYEWGRYLVTINKVDSDVYEKENARFYQEYLQGKLNVLEFLRFALKPLSENSYTELCQWRDDYFKTCIEPIVKPKAIPLIEQHRAAGDHLAIVTATNSFITAPVKNYFNVDTLIATEPVKQNGEFSGEVLGVPCFGPGKVTRVEEWIKDTDFSFHGSYFYSDSRNDIPLLERVEHPIVVDADDVLTAHAIKNSWKQISLK